MIAAEVPGRWRLRVGPLAVVVRPPFLVLLAGLAAAGAVVIAVVSHPMDVLVAGALAGIVATGPLHESAHALAARAVGCSPQALVLRGAGWGVAIPDEDLAALTARQAALVFLAGPAANVVMAAVFTVALLAGARFGIPEAAGVGLVGMAAGALVQTAGDLLPVPPADLGRLLALRRNVHTPGKPQ